MGKKTKRRSNDNEDILTQELIDNTKNTIDTSNKYVTNGNEGHKLKKVSNELKFKKSDISNNEKFTNFSQYLKVANLTSKKDILLKGLANNASIKNKLNLSPKKEIRNVNNEVVLNGTASMSASSSDDIRDSVLLKHESNSSDDDIQTHKKASKHVVNKKHIKQEKVSDTESSCNEDTSNNEQEQIPVGKRKSSSESGIEVHNNLNQKRNESTSDTSTSSSDDDSSSIDTRNNNKKYPTKIKSDEFINKSNKSELLENFQSENNLKSIHTKINFTLDDVDSDCEIYFAQIPKSVNPNLLLNKTLYNDEDTKIKLDGQKYLISMENKKQDPIMLIANTKTENCNMKLLNIVGTIKAQQVVKSKKKRHSSEITNNRVPYPENLKIRHPIFGSDYKNKIKLDKNIQIKLDEAVVAFNKKIKKKKHSVPIQECNESKDDELLFAMFNEHKMKKTNKTELDNIQPLKRKRKKSTSEISNNTTNLLNQTTFKLDSSDEFEKRPTKKHKNADLDYSKDLFEQTTLLLSPEKTKKKNKTYIANSTMINSNNTVPNFDNDLSQISITESTKKKKKKHKEKDMDVTKQILNQIEIDMHKKHKVAHTEIYKSDDSRKLKKKKKHHA